MRITIVFTFWMLTTTLWSQYDITGSVTTSAGEPLEFASVFIPDTDYATYTDGSGQFFLPGVAAGDYQLLVTYVGYRKQTLMISVEDDLELEVQMVGIIYNLDSLEISGNRVDADGIFTHSNVDMDLLQATNLGQDLPVLLGNTTNMVYTSDAGAGIGYTGMRLRGSDQTRINVTINGIPWNDPESHGVFFVNLPDLATDASSIQIQRGVGTSTNGPGAFGGAVAIETHDIHVNPYARFGGMYGSFDSRRLTAALGTGIIGDGYSIDFRYSKIDSDGYIDRATSDLSSYSISMSKISENRAIRLDIISGDEVTYQSWFGAPESVVNNDSQGILDHYNRNRGSLYNTAADSVNLFGSDRRYNYYLYDNQVDDYGQRHVQLHWSEIFSDRLTTKTSLFYTRGRGFFEEFRRGESLINDYNITDLLDDDDNVIDETDLVRRRWLDNHLLGVNITGQYLASDAATISFGGSASQYLGDHFGDVVEVSQRGPLLRDFRQWYAGNGDKFDANAYAKVDYQIGSRWAVFADMQYRVVDYTIDGTDNDLQVFDVEENYGFFNPKAGLSYTIDDKQQLYASFARGHREPVRSDFTDNDVSTIPRPERLDNYEMGYRHTTDRLQLSANAYLMQYTDQLIPTGALNDVGALLRVNVEDSYRAGIELEADYAITTKWQVGGNLALSRNRIETFTEVLEDYTDGFAIVTNTYSDTDIALSPDIVANARLTYRPMEAMTVRWLTQYVGEQYLDNTSNDQRTIDAYLVNDLQMSYDIKGLGVQGVHLNLLIRNVLNAQYSANGYTYSYIIGEVITENYLYPQAGRNVMLGVTVDL